MKDTTPDLRQIGIWTPWAEVLCRECDEATTKTGRLTVDWDTYEMKWTEEGEGHGFCTQCGKKVWVRDDVATLTRIQKVLGGNLQQTGGMCSALAVPLPDRSLNSPIGGGTVVLTTMDDPPCIGVYGPDAWEEGEESKDCIYLKISDQTIVDAVKEQIAKHTATQEVK